MPPVRQIVSDWWSNYARMGHAIAFFCLALIAIVWTVTVDRISFEESAAISRAMKSTSNLAIAYEEHTIRTLKDVDHILLFIRDEYAQQRSTLKIASMLEKGALDPSLFILVSLFDRHGDMIFSSLEAKPINVADRDYFRFQKNSEHDELVIGAPIVGRASGSWTIPIAPHHQPGRFLRRNSLCRSQSGLLHQSLRTGRSW